MTVIYRVILFTMLVASPVAEVLAQESLPANIEPSVEPEQTDRIVESRPPLYTIKRVAHPLTWVELGIKPVLRSAESGRIHSWTARHPGTDKTAGVRFGVGGAGSGSGIGPAVTLFHRDLLGRGIEVEMPLLYTYSQYEVYQFNARIPVRRESPTSAPGLSIDLATSYRSRPRDQFFGVGNDSHRDDERQLRTVTREASLGFTAKLSDDWTSKVRGVHRAIGVTKPSVGFSAQDHFDNSSVPGLFGATIHSAVFSIGRDTTVRENNSFKGGTDEFGVSFNQSTGGRAFRYWRYIFDSEHFFWLTDDGRKVIAARGFVETNVATAGHVVPFFDMPSLGSLNTLRGFENFRFRDKSALAVSLEYRYRIWPRLDWGLFIDEGQVAPQLGDFALNRFHAGYGVRLFVWPSPKSPISFDLGRSRESWRLYINFNARF